MICRNVFSTCIFIMLSACVQPAVFKGDGYAYIRSNYPIIKINGDRVEPVYELDMEAGENTLVIVYKTYRYDYYCKFSWTAEANTVYEVTDQENRYPLTLYRWIKTNSLWASRLDPMDPLECIKKPRRGNNTDE